MCWRACGRSTLPARYVVQGNTDIAVADFDFSAAFPWLDEVPAAHRAVAEWTHDQLSDDELGLSATSAVRAPDPGRRPAGARLPWLAGQPDRWLARRPRPLGDRRSASPGPMPGSIACGHTHVADVRDFGRRLIVNPGSCGYAFDGDAGAAWAMLTIDDDVLAAELMRTAYDPSRPPTRSALGVWPATSIGRPPSGPGSSCDEARTRRRRVVVTGLGAVTPLGNDPATFWSRLVAGESGVRTIGAFDPARLTSRIAGEVQDFDPGDVLDRKEQRRNDRVTQFALVAARQAMDQAGLPGAPRGHAGGGDRGHHRLWAGRLDHALRPDPDLHRARTRSHQPFLRAHGHRQHGGRPGGHHDRCPGAQLRYGQRLRHRPGMRSENRPRRSCAAMPR